MRPLWEPLVTTDLWWWPHRCHTGQAQWLHCSWWLVCSAWSCQCHLSVSSQSCSNHTLVCSKHSITTSDKETTSIACLFNLEVSFVVLDIANSWSFLFLFCLPDTNLIILWLEVVISTHRVIIEWFDAAIPSWTLHIMTWHVTRDRYVMISLVSPQWYWRQPRGGFSRESHLICVTRILHFLQWSVSFIVCLVAVYGHTRLSSLVPVVTAEKVAEEELETGNIIQTFSRGLKLIRGKQTCQLRHQGRCAGQRCSHISGE